MFSSFVTERAHRLNKLLRKHDLVCLSRVIAGVSLYRNNFFNWNELQTMSFVKNSEIVSNVTAALICFWKKAKARSFSFNDVYAAVIALDDARDDSSIKEGSMQS